MGKSSEVEFEQGHDARLAIVDGRLVMQYATQEAADLAEAAAEEEQAILSEPAVSTGNEQPMVTYTVACPYTECAVMVTDTDALMDHLNEDHPADEEEDDDGEGQ